MPRIAPSVLERARQAVIAGASIAVCPKIRRPKPLPIGLEAWKGAQQLYGDSWFEETALYWFAWLAAPTGEPAMPFAEGASPVMRRYVRQSRYPPFEILAVRKRKPSKQPAPQFGFIKFEARVWLDCPDAAIVRTFREFLASARRKLKRDVRCHRPPRPAVLKRDFVTYVLDREGWQLIEIEKQLAYMQCPKLPRDCKAYLRKTRARFKRIETEVRRPYLEKQQAELRGFIHALMEDLMPGSSPDDWILVETAPRTGSSRRKA